MDRIEPDKFESIGHAAERVVRSVDDSDPRFQTMESPMPATANALAETKTTAVKAWEGQVEADAFLTMIERAARDPNVDLDKMERLMAMRERNQARVAELEFDRAMATAQAEMEPVRKDANNPQTKSRYASFYALDTAIRPIYTKHGFSVTFDTGDGAPADYVRVVAKVAHGAGHRERPHIDMPADGKGAKGGDVMTKTHATGSAVKYGRRYLLAMIFNIADSDDDGNAAGKTGREADLDRPISKEQVNALREIIENAGGDVARFCEFGGVGALSEISVRNYDSAVRAAKQKAAAK